MAGPDSISVKQISAAARGSVAKVLETHKAAFPKPNFRFGFFPPHWWLGIVIRNPDFGDLRARDAQKLASDLQRSVAAAVPALKGGKPGAIFGDGTLTLGFVPPKDILMIEE